jgi:hypothetical protein
MNAKRTLVLAIVAHCAAGLLQAQGPVPEYRYQTVDFNRETFPFVQGEIVTQGLTAINDKGIVAGSFETNQNVLSNFLYADGNFRLLAGDSGVVRGINNDGELAGFATIRFPGRIETTGFVSDSVLQFVHILQAPGCNLTETVGLNDKARQLTVGDARDAKSGVFVGVVFKAGHFQRFVVAGSGVPPRDGVNVFSAFKRFYSHGKFTKLLEDPDAVINTALTGVNNAGEMVGYYGDPLSRHPLYLRRDGSAVDIESSLSRLPGITGPALPADISNASEIAGTYVKGDTLSGFVLLDGNAFEIAFPGAEQTEVSGINAAGTAVGSYFAGGVRHGFIAVRNGTPSTM